MTALSFDSNVHHSLDGSSFVRNTHIKYNDAYDDVTKDTALMTIQLIDSTLLLVRIFDFG